MMIKDLQKNFTYKYDASQYVIKDAWHIMQKVDGKYIGDCEDYALTALYLLNNKSMLRFWWSLLNKDGSIEYYKIFNAGHAVLRYKGKRLDNIHNGWIGDSDKMQYYEYKYDFTFINIAKRMLYAKLHSWIFWQSSR